MSGTKATQVAPWKQEVVNKLSGLFDRYPVVGVLDISNLPAREFQQTRQKLRGEAEIVVAKNTLIELALRKVSKRKEKLEEMVKYLNGQSALIFSRMNPFRLNKALRQNRINAPAKPGSKSVRDVVIPAGETEFAPGPIVAELQRAGIKARIQAGKVVIMEECHLLKEGDVITKEISDVLAKFGILPLELGLKLRAAYEAGMIFAGEVLEYDEQKAVEHIQLAWTSAFNLAVNTDYPTSATVGIMLSKATSAAQNLALNACIPATQIIPMLLSRASAEMLGLSAALGTKDKRSLDKELMEILGITPEEAKPEEKPPEEKPKEGEK